MMNDKEVIDALDAVETAIARKVKGVTGKVTPDVWMDMLRAASVHMFPVISRTGMTDMELYYFTVMKSLITTVCNNDMIKDDEIEINFKQAAEDMHQTIAEIRAQFVGAPPGGKDCTVCPIRDICPDRTFDEEGKLTCPAPESIQ